MKTAGKKGRGESVVEKGKKKKSRVWKVLVKSKGVRVKGPLMACGTSQKRGGQRKKTWIR